MSFEDELRDAIAKGSAQAAQVQAAALDPDSDLRVVVQTLADGVEAMWIALADLGVDADAAVPFMTGSVIRMLMQLHGGSQL